MEVKIGTKVRLNAGEQAVVLHISDIRSKNNNPKTDIKISKQSKDEIELEGFAAEIAFCKLFNVMPDLSVHPRSAKLGTDKGDVIINGKVVDIKWTKYLTGKLIASIHKERTTDFHCLMVGRFPEYTFKGFIKTEELINDKNISDLGYGKVYTVNQDILQTLNSVMK